MKQALRDITHEIERVIHLKKDDVVLDIGSNDGTLLRSYRTAGIRKVGVEPATNLAAEGKKGVDVFINDFWSSRLYRSKHQKKARVVTAIGMFYDMEDPNSFIRDIADVLTLDGVFVAQLMCLKNMLDTSDVGNICHEHLEYYSLATLTYLFRKNSLEVIDIEHNEVNGGSYRIYARPIGGTVRPRAGAHERIQRYMQSEKHLGSVKTHLDFFKRIEKNKKRTVDFIKKEVTKGKTVWVYGASTKGNTILQYFGLDYRLITGAADRSQDKWGKETVGTHIPIYPEKVARHARPDYFLVLPYAFIKEFIKRETRWLAGGRKFIVPLPTFTTYP